MINFLRKIRYGMLVNGNFSRYALYAIGEILLVVVGILIALQIDNWNEQKKIEEMEFVFLKRLLVDLQNDKTYFEIIHERKNNKINAANSVIKFAYSKNQDSILNMIPSYLTLVSWNAIIPNQNTFNEMISSGNLNILQSDSLKNNLLQLDRNYKALIDWDEIVKQDAHISKFWSETGEMNPYNYLPLNESLSKTLELENKWSEAEIDMMMDELKLDVETILKSNKFRSGVMSSRDDYERQLLLVAEIKGEIGNLIRQIESELTR